MGSNATEQAIREYLLGRLPSAARSDFEERLLTDDEFYEELIMVEDELVDEYLRDELPPADRQSFQSHFINAAEHQEKVRFARAFKKYVTAEQAPQRQPDSARDSTATNVLPLDVARQKRSFFSLLPFRNPILSYGLAAAMLVVLVGTGWIIWKNFVSAGRGGPYNVLAVTLTPGLSRGDVASNRIAVPDGTGTVRLQLLLPENRYQSYEASLLDAEDRIIANKTNLTPESLNGQAAVGLDVSGKIIPPGDYRLKLNGVNPDGSTESVATYSFRIQTH